jgi:hypothetical protein
VCRSKISINVFLPIFPPVKQPDLLYKYLPVTLVPPYHILAARFSKAPCKTHVIKTRAILPNERNLYFDDDVTMRRSVTLRRLERVKKQIILFDEIKNSSHRISCAWGVPKRHMFRSMSAPRCLKRYKLLLHDLCLAVENGYINRLLNSSTSFPSNTLTEFFYISKTFREEFYVCASPALQKPRDR